MVWANTNPAQYVGEVTGSRVNVRTGPHLSYDVLMSAEEGQKVYVIEEKGDWLKIRLPRDLRLWIHKDMVDVQKNGENGLVSKKAM